VSKAPQLVHAQRTPHRTERFRKIPICDRTAAHRSDAQRKPELQTNLIGIFGQDFQGPRADIAQPDDPNIHPPHFGYDNSGQTMQRLTKWAALPLVLIGVCVIGQTWGQTSLSHPDSATETPRTEVRLPNGKLQVDEMLKADREDSVKDAKRLVEVAQELQKDLDQESAAHVLSIADIHRTEDIERLAKRIRARLRRY